MVDPRESAVGHDRTARNFEASVRQRLPLYARKYQWDIICPFRKLSEQVCPSDWIKLAEAVDDSIRKGYEGIVVAHGTDTLIFSSAALSIMLRNPPVPILITGSNIPLESKDTDATQNIGHALYAANTLTYGGVLVSFAGTPKGESILCYGPKVRKDASREDVFQPARGPAYGRVSSGGLFGKPRIKLEDVASAATPSAGKYEAIIAVDDHVAYFSIYPGFRPKYLTSVADMGIRAIVLGLYGVGTLCTEQEYSLIPPLRELRSAGVAIVLVSQHYGTIELEEYGSSTSLRNLDCIKLPNYTPEVAIVRTMWALGQCQTVEDLKSLLEKGEVGQ